MESKRRKSLGCVLMLVMNGKRERETGNGWEELIIAKANSNGQV
jgi:hypothetical protein